jgi:hypothetical protein
MHARQSRYDTNRIIWSDPLRNESTTRMPGENVAAGIIISLLERSFRGGLGSAKTALEKFSASEPWVD